MITSLQNTRVKEAIKLRDARQRQKQGRTIIDGAREILRAVQAGVQLIEVYVCDELCRSDDCRQVMHTLSSMTHLRPASPTSTYLPPDSDDPPSRNEFRPTPTELIPVSAAVFEKLAFGERAEGIVAVAETPSRTLADLQLPNNPLIAVLEGVEKPGNIGAVLRSADGAGIAALIVADGGTDLYNPNTIRASLGTIFTVPVCAASTAETLVWLRQQGIKIYAAWVEADRDYTVVDYRGPTAIVLGSEADGLSVAWQPVIEQPAIERPVMRSTKSITSLTGAGGYGSAAGYGPAGAIGPNITPIKLPMLGVADSLNVSNTAAVLFYEALRQRRI